MNIIDRVKTAMLKRLARSCSCTSRRLNIAPNHNVPAMSLLVSAVTLLIRMVPKMITSTVRNSIMPNTPSLNWLITWVNPTRSLVLVRLVRLYKAIMVSP